MSLYKTLAYLGIAVGVIAGGVVSCAYTTHRFDPKVDLEGTVMQEMYVPEASGFLGKGTGSYFMKVDTPNGKKTVDVSDEKLWLNFVAGKTKESLDEEIEQGSQVVLRGITEWAAEREKIFDITADRVEVR